MSSFTPPPRVLTALDEIKLRLTAEPVNGGKGRPSLSTRLAKNNVRLTVYTNVEGDAGGGKIEAALDSPNFFVFLRYIDMAIKSKEHFHRKIENKNYTWSGGKRSDHPSVTSTIIVEREEDGSIFISIVNNMATPVKFYFLPSTFHTYKNKDGQVNRAEITQIYASAWIDLLARLTPHVLADNYIPPEPKNNDFKGGNRNNGGGQNQGGGYNNQQRNSGNSNAFGDDGNWGGDDDGLSFN